MVTITEAYLHAHFAHYRDQALREPVAIEEDGQARLVMLPVAEFRRLTALDDRRAYFAWELPDRLGNALDTASPAAATARFDDEMPA